MYIPNAQHRLLLTITVQRLPYKSTKSTLMAHRSNFGQLSQFPNPRPRGHLSSILLTLQFNVRLTSIHSQLSLNVCQLALLTTDS
jgi:hypothetical protein